MRANKYAIYWSVGITVVSFFVALIFHGSENLFYDISLACFGSALLAVVVAYTAYSAERRDAMEQFWGAALNAVRQLEKIPNIHFNAPTKLVRNIMTEELRGGHKYRDQLYERIEPQLLIDENTTSEEIETMLSREADEVISDAKQQLIKAVDAYIAFSELSLADMDNAYGKMEFVLANKTIRRDAYINIYDRIRNFRNKCLEEARHFKYLKQGSGNIVVCFDKAVELDKMLYVTKTELGNEEVYAYMVYKLLQKLETFRSKIYNIKPKYYKPFPIQGYMKFDDPIEMKLLEERKKNRLRLGVTEKAEKYKAVD